MYQWNVFRFKNFSPSVSSQLYLLLKNNKWFHTSFGKWKICEDNDDDHDVTIGFVNTVHYQHAISGIIV